jgi:hypothetical protein
MLAIGIPDSYDSHRKLVKNEDGTYLETQADNMSQHSQNSNPHRFIRQKSRTNLGSILSEADESWQCSSSCSLETSKCQSIADLYEDPNALFLARILEDKLTDQFAKRHGKIADMAEEIFDL